MRGSGVADDPRRREVLPRTWRRDVGVARRGALALRDRDGSSSSRRRRGAWTGQLVFCFGLLHDTRRENEAVDPEHGARAAAFAAELQSQGLLPLDDARFALLIEALRLHSDGRLSDDTTIGTCWDADRLHLPRVSIEPNPAFFSTPAAHGPAPLAAAGALREDGPPGWEALVAFVGGLH